LAHEAPENQRVGVGDGREEFVVGSAVKSSAVAAVFEDVQCCSELITPLGCSRTVGITQYGLLCVKLGYILSTVLYCTIQVSGTGYWKI
jgi:hypothetical protein